MNDKKPSEEIADRLEDEIRKLGEKIDGLSESENELDELRDKRGRTASEEVIKRTKIDGKSAEEWHNKGNSLYGLEKYEDAVEAYDKALKIEPKDAEVWYSKGVVLGRLGRYEDAVEAYDKALEIEPKYAEVWNNKGLDLGKLGRYEESSKCFEKAKDYGLDSNE